MDWFKGISSPETMFFFHMFSHKPVQWKYWLNQQLLDYGDWSWFLCINVDLKGDLTNTFGAKISKIMGIDWDRMG